VAKNHGTIEFGSTDFDTDPQFGTPCWIERRSRSTKQAITATNDDNRRAATPHDYPATAFCIAGWGFPGTVEYTAATFNVPRGRFPDPNEYATTPFDTVRRCHGRRATESKPVEPFDDTTAPRQRVTTLDNSTPVRTRYSGYASEYASRSGQISEHRQRSRFETLRPRRNHSTRGRCFRRFVVAGYRYSTRTRDFAKSATGTANPDPYCETVASRRR